uniref:Leucine-rich repeat protein n=1 Tax=Paramoeba aestuarina TaxID=180227 RepID=A0A7S4PLA3_9EUKA|mmetsp:Transcript_8492/g.12856  ORF Transcript_8492/g.12856 Transcript_8492/m.12856 type:complete len:291 (+) Transcript_8492:31-903(+)
MYKLCIAVFMEDNLATDASEKELFNQTILAVHVEDPQNAHRQSEPLSSVDPIQKAMQSLVEGVSNKEEIYRNRSGWNDVFTWDGLSFTEDKTLQKINWNSFNLIGKIRFGIIPRTVDSLQLRNNIFMCTADFNMLPSGLRLLDLTNNEFTGEVHFDIFPQKLVNIWLSQNLFFGSVTLHNLPETLGALYLDHNKLCGTVDLTHLPPCLTILTLNGNSFHGALRLNKLPNQMITLHIGMNGFIGWTDFTNLPESLVSLDVSHTGIAGDVCIHNEMTCVTTNSWVKVRKEAT